MVNNSPPSNMVFQIPTSGDPPSEVTFTANVYSGQETPVHIHGVCDIITTITENATSFGQLFVIVAAKWPTSDKLQTVISINPFFGIVGYPGTDLNVSYKFTDRAPMSSSLARRIR